MLNLNVEQRLCMKEINPVLYQVSAQICPPVFIPHQFVFYIKKVTQEVTHRSAKFFEMLIKILRNVDKSSYVVTFGNGNGK